MTTIEELTNSKDESKQIYGKYVAEKLSEGFTPSDKSMAQWKSEPGYHQDELWDGVRGYQEFTVISAIILISNLGK